jgi:hypothetical protein
MRKLTLVTLLVALSLVTAAGPSLASSDPQTDASAEQDLLSLVNQERSSRGLNTLSRSDRLTSIARNHSEEMASSGDLHHNDNLPSEVGSYSELGENVGAGFDAEGVHDAFMDSSGHRANILGPTTQIGIGAMRDENGYLWVTEVFYKPASSGSGTSSSTNTTTTTHRTRRSSSSTQASTGGRVRAVAVAVHELFVPAAVRVPVISEPLATRTVSALGSLAGAYV